MQLSYNHGLCNLQPTVQKYDDSSAHLETVPAGNS